MRKLLTLSLLGAAFTASTAFGAIITTYTSSGLFNSSDIVGNHATVTEDFNTNDSLFTTFEIPGSAGNGNSGSGFPGFGGTDTSFLTFAGQRTSRVTTNYTESVTLDAGDMVAFGGTWDLTPYQGIGSGLRLTIQLVGGPQVVVPILGYATGTTGSSPFFFGFTSDEAFSSVTISQGGQNGLSSEGFALDNLIISQAGEIIVDPQDPGDPDPPSGVPEPSTFGLMGLAMVGLGAVRRFRR